MVLTGLDVVSAGGFAELKGRSVGIVCNQASIDRNLVHILDLLAPLHESGFLTIKAVFGPQHGLFGHTQDNMVEWEGWAGSRWRVHSLYGERREPTEEMLEGIDLLVIDLPDVGARYYTFIWTMTLCVRSCRRLGIPVLILDRPNPIGGIAVEGTVLLPEFGSFVGLHPFPMRHGMTIGEIARHVNETPKAPRREINEEWGPEIVSMSGWRRDMFFEDTGLPWAMPSPNMPTVDTAIVYPGGCLIEGTNLSEGRGTTRPFEIVGAPYLDGHRFCAALNARNLPGVFFRPVQFEPTFNKHAKQICEGCFIHVLDRLSFKPVLTTVAILQESIRQAGGSFAWKEPPYEYEYEKRPIDILAGNDWLVSEVDAMSSLKEIEERFLAECEAFSGGRKLALLY